jgi:hypothetical protein
MYWPPLYSKKQATCSLPDLDNQCQWGIDDFWPCMMVNQCARWSLMTIYGVLTCFIPWILMVPGPYGAAHATTSPPVQKWSSEAVLFIKSSLVANKTLCESEL